LAEQAPQALFGITTGARVAEYIRTLVWNGTLKAGDRVRQEEIATALGVSRIPVREGLVAVESEGLVRHEPQKGVFVVGLDRDFVRDHYALLGLVLGYVIEQASRREEKDLARRLDGLRHRLDAAHTVEEVFPLGLEFKELICEVGGSARVQAAVGRMERLVPGNVYAEIPGAIEVTKHGVAAVAEAIAAGDGDAASSACREMTRALGDLVIAELARRDML